MNVTIEPTWKAILQEYFDTESFQTLTDFVRQEYQNKTVYPHPKNLFNAFNMTPFEQVKVVILGQDPYHNPGQAHGLCFSVPDGVTPPSSLKNIYKEIADDLSIDTTRRTGDLTHWAAQGVFLLNSVLSVVRNTPTSHAGKGWEEFTDYVIQKLSDEHTGLVFMLWGNYAKKKGANIDWTKHLVLEAAHPSPFSAHNGFFGCKHFSQTNEYLEKQGRGKIEW
jgi:uracil-DNA glycosylase